MRQITREARKRWRREAEVPSFDPPASAVPSRTADVLRLLAALDAADEAVQELDWKSREWHEFDHGDIKRLQPYEACENCEGQRNAVAAYRVIVAPASADASEAAS